MGRPILRRPSGGASLLQALPKNIPVPNQTEDKRCSEWVGALRYCLMRVPSGKEEEGGHSAISNQRRRRYLKP
jgi:hypothetical protein